jgi:hypothetical protein
MCKNLSIALIIVFIFTSPSSFSIEKLRFIGDQNIATGEKFKETEIGGLSGLFLDKKTNKILAISDDRSKTNDARFYEFNLKLDEKSFSITPNEVVILKNKDGRSFPNGTIDFEDIALLNDDLIITSEGSANKEPPINPEIFLFTRDGKYKKNIDVPFKFNPSLSNAEKSGVRDNLAFEALTVAKDGKNFWVGTEETLVQDGQTSSPKQGSNIRLIQYKDLKPVKEIAYGLDKIPNITVAGLTFGVTGLSAMLEIDDSTFYTIERSYSPLARIKTIRLFKFKISNQETDISNMQSIKGKTIVTIEKELVANLQDFTSLMSLKFQNLDNIEGITWGPKLSNGHDTLILVSDNNFNKNQRTQFLAFEIIP